MKAFFQSDLIPHTGYPHFVGFVISFELIVVVTVFVTVFSEMIETPSVDAPC